MPLLWCVALATVLLSFINAFGAWMVIRRKPWIGWLFMASAALLVIAAASFINPSAITLPLLATGLVMASLTSLLNAHFVIGDIKVRNHALRLGVALALFILAFVAVQ